MLQMPDGGGYRRARVVSALALAALACAAGVSPQAWAADASIQAVTQDASEVRAYWTAERMRNAIPLGPEASASERQARRGRTARRVRNVAEPPKRTHGKVFFTMDALNYVCSGTSLDAPNRSVVWTAGHCVYDPALLGGFADNWAFVPAYRRGDEPRPYGTWPAERLATTQQWKNSGAVCPPGIVIAFCGDVRYDLGAAEVVTRNDRKLESVVGGRGIAFNGPRDITYRAYGYPAEDPYNGRHMYLCESPYAGADNSVGNPKPMRINCDMTGGSSGGGWIHDGKVRSVISYGYEGDDTHLYGPYQGGAAKNLYDSING